MRGRPFVTSIALVAWPLARPLQRRQTESLPPFRLPQFSVLMARAERQDLGAVGSLRKACDDAISFRELSDQGLRHRSPCAPCRQRPCGVLPRFCQQLPTILIFRPMSARSCRVCRKRGGVLGATCGSTPAGPELMPTTFAGTRRNWWRSRPTSSWPTAPRPCGPLLQVTRTVPIVFPVAGDPVGGGLVESLARPGGNVTGFMSIEYTMGGKWLELLKEIAPNLTRSAVLRDPTQGSGNSLFAVIQAMAPSLGMEVKPVSTREAPEIERTVADCALARLH